MADTSNFILFTFVLIRMSGFILLNPLLGRRNIPMIIKSGMILLFTYVVFSSSNQIVTEISSTLEYAVLLLKEFAVGYIVGFVMNLFFYVIIFAGEIIDLQMGISMSKIYDIQSNASISLSSTYYNALFVIIFFMVNGHLALFKLLLTSGEIVPYGNVLISGEIANRITDIFCLCTMLAVKMAFPILAIAFLFEVGMGILMKTIPQINIFVINIQIKLFVGLIIMLILFGGFSSFLGNLVELMVDSVQQIFNLMI